MSFQERYQYNPKTDLVGKGGFSKVYRAKDVLLDRIVALKIFTPDTSEKYDLITEIRKAIRLNHVNLCQYYDVAILETINAFGEDEKFQIGIMEFMDLGNLKQHLHQNPDDLDKLLKDTLRGLAFLHKNNIIHRDLKPLNILVTKTFDGPVAKIADFNISRLITDDHTSSSLLLGAIEYMAPEQFNPVRYGINGKINMNLDIWSFGVMVYELVMKEPLFGSRSKGSNTEEVMHMILNLDFDDKLEDLPEPYRQVAKKCLVKDAKARISDPLKLIEILEMKNSYEINVEKKEKSKEEPEPENYEHDTKLISREKSFEQPLNGNRSTFQPDKSIDDNVSSKTPINKTRRSKNRPLKKIAIIGALILIVVFAYVLIKPFSSPSSIKRAKQYEQRKDSITALTWYRKAANEGNAEAMFNIGSYYENGYAGLAKDENEALNWYRKAADKEDGMATYNIGKFYHSATGGLQYSLDSALIWYRKAADKGNEGAMNTIGNFYANGFAGLPIDQKEALAWYRKAADKGDAASMASIGYYYDNGLAELTKNDIEGLKWYRKAADKGNAVAMYSIAIDYEYGLGGINANQDSALMWYRKAADHGNAAAMFEIGKKYEKGLAGLSADSKEALVWYRKSADGGSAPAMFAIGAYYENGEGGLDKDAKEALKWYQSAADNGNASAMFEIGYSYETGYAGLEKDFDLAFSWYERAANNGNAGAMTNMGVHYHNGYGKLKKDQNEALVWFHKAAAMGDVTSTYNIGIYYENGHGGLGIDKAEAISWYQKAADQGYDNAKTALQRLSNK